MAKQAHKRQKLSQDQISTLAGCLWSLFCGLLVTAAMAEEDLNATLTWYYGSQSCGAMLCKVRITPYGCRV